MHELAGRVDPQAAACETLGSPISLLIRNKDWENWQQTMHAEDTPPPDATGAIRPIVTRLTRTIFASAACVKPRFFRRAAIFIPRRLQTEVMLHLM